MHVELCKRLALAGDAKQYTQPVSMEGYNRVQVEAVAFVGSVGITVQQSNDLENWTSLGSADTASASSDPYTLGTAQTPTCAYVRLELEENAGTPSAAIIAVGVNLSAQ